MKNNLDKCLIKVPNSVLSEIRFLSARRKAENMANKTQQAIIIELLEKGLLLAKNDLPPSNLSTTV